MRRSIFTTVWCAMMLAFLPTSVHPDEAGGVVVVQGRNDIVVREVFRCQDETGHERSFTYHLNRWDYGYKLWVVSTAFDFRDLSILGRTMKPSKEQLAIIVIYDSRVDGQVERLDVIEQRAREVLSGTRMRMEERHGTDWGPYTLVQDLTAQRFELDHYQPYAGGTMGRVHLRIGPLDAPGGRIGGFVRADGMNLINDNARLTACVFNREPVQFSLQSAVLP